MANRFEVMTLEELTTLVEKGKEENGQPLTNDDLVTIRTRMEYWQKVKDTLKSLKRTIHDDEDDNNPLSKRIDIKYESVEILNPIPPFTLRPTGKTSKGCGRELLGNTTLTIWATLKMDKACITYLCCSAIVQLTRTLKGCLARRAEPIDALMRLSELSYFLT